MQNGTLIGNASVGGSTNRFSITLPQATWRIDVAAAFSCGSQARPVGQTPRSTKAP